MATGGGGGSELIIRVRSDKPCARDSLENAQVKHLRRMWAARPMLFEIGSGLHYLQRFVRPAQATIHPPFFRAYGDVRVWQIILFVDPCASAPASARSPAPAPLRPPLDPLTEKQVRAYKRRNFLKTRQNRSGPADNQSKQKKEHQQTAALPTAHPALDKTREEKAIPSRAPIAPPQGIQHDPLGVVRVYKAVPFASLPPLHASKQHDGTHDALLSHRARPGAGARSLGAASPR